MLVYLGLGSNLGERENILRSAIDKINERVGEVISLSAFYETMPDGFVSEHPFLNAVCGVETKLEPLEILAQTEAVERELGRNRKSVNRMYQDRTLDIDILLVEGCVLYSEVLTIPHPRMHERLFVLEPLSEIAPEIVHPVLQKTISQLLKGISGGR